MTYPHPFSVDVRRSVMFLSLDTPGSRVNIFSVQAANQLVSILSEVDARDVKAVVVQSKKPRSFLNGAQLMLANAVKTEEDASRLTEPVRNAYAALRNLAVPSIALVEGTCFGCGVELSLSCHFRLAIAGGDTEFYMTEIADYLVNPAFGSTWELPKLLGLSAATDFLVWGRRYDASAALEVGLVDEVFTVHDREEGLHRFVDRVRTGAFTRAARLEADLREIATETRARIAKLPPDYRRVYEDCFALLEANADPSAVEADARRREVAACGRSAMTPLSKAAQGFFFLRQMSEQLSLRGAMAHTHTHIGIRGLPDLARLLSRRAFADVTISTGAPAGEGGIELSALGGDEPGHARVITDVHAGAKGTSVYLCIEDDRIRFFEVAAQGTDGADVYAALTRMAYRGVKTRAQGALASGTLLDAFARPVFGAAARSSDIAVAHALRDFGYVDLPRTALGVRMAPIVSAFDAITDEAPLHDAVVDAVSLSLLAWVRARLASAELAHPAMADVMACELLSFPVGRGGLCRYLTPDRVTRALERANVRALAGVDAVISAEEYVRDGRSFYR